jgi:HD-GYP domain-containing protein (c-di-GMP phosphodiesterase class II)
MSHSSQPEQAPPAGPEAQVQGLSAMAARSLGAALAQRRMYPPEHPIAARALQSLMLYLERILALVPEWRLALVGGKLLASGRQVDEGGEGLVPFIDGLKTRGIETIVFKRSVGVEELRRFISLMILDPKWFAGRGLPDLMSKEGIVSIEAGRLVIDEPAETEHKKAVLDETGPEVLEAYDNGLTFIEEAMRSLREGRRISLEEAESFVTTVAKQMQQDRSPFLILTALKSHHAYTFTHIINVCILTVAQIEALGGDARAVQEFGLASMMHDIGKTLLAGEILSKPGKLTPEELLLMQRHPQDGVHILRETPGVPDLALLVALEHHMRYNHGGYPRPRHPRPLHPCSLMTNLADTYDAMRSRRSYQEEFPPEKVASIINDRAGVDFHPQLAMAFLQIMGAYPPGTRVRMDTGEEAVVVRVNPANPYRPVVRMLRDNTGQLLQRLEIVDLMEKERVGGRFARNVLSSIKAQAPPSRPPAAAPAGSPGAGV